ncbi:unnamed protein product, partial [Polarella glacialis]
ELLATHQREVPELLAELQGIASGCGLPFRIVLAVSLAEELSYFAPVEMGLRANRSADHCSDYAFCTAAHCADVHNEDGDLADGKLFTGFVRLGASNFTVLNYAGDLLGGMSAMAFNSHGLAFSLNWVGPASCDTRGLGRNFVSRLLLEATSWEEAREVISRRHAVGHNYQLMDFRRRQIANFEVAQEKVSERRILEPFFHANQYQTLEVPGQIINNSSSHRLARVAQLPKPQTPEDALRILGDQEDRSYPIFHDNLSHARGELSDWTLASVLFDLDKGSVELMAGNPASLKVQRRFLVPTGRPPSTGPRSKDVLI